jgi:hypothetical protein
MTKKIRRAFLPTSLGDSPYLAHKLRSIMWSKNPCIRGYDFQSFLRNFLIDEKRIIKIEKKSMNVKKFFLGGS